MKKIMVISVIDGEQGAAFFDSYVDARQHAMDVECGMGGRSYLYRLKRNMSFLSLERTIQEEK